MITLLRRLLFMLLLACVVTPSLANAQTPAPVMPSPVPAWVDVKLMVVQASEQAGAVDPRLGSFAQTLLSSTPFLSFTVLAQHEMRLGDTEEHAVSVSDVRRVRCRLISHDPQQAQLRVELLSGDTQIVDTTVTIRRNKSFVVAMRSRDGTTLLIPLTVRY
jgi:hypothetical protein